MGSAACWQSQSGCSANLSQGLGAKQGRTALASDREQSQTACFADMNTAGPSHDGIVRASTRNLGGGLARDRAYSFAIWSPERGAWAKRRCTGSESDGSAWQSARARTQFHVGWRSDEAALACPPRLKAATRPWPRTVDDRSGETLSARRTG